MTFAKLPSASLDKKLLSEVINSFISYYKNSFQNNLEFDTHFEIPNEPFLILDESLLHNAFYALTKNASEALSDNNHSKILFKAYKEGSMFKLLVSNSGTIIPPEIVQNLFQIGSSSKLNKEQNFGIGLAMAKKIMLDHGGDLVLFENSSIHGVVFKFMFPIPPQSNDYC